jgi:type VI protein secretion system component Hcp
MTAGDVPSTLDGRTFPAGSVPTYSLELDGEKGAIPLLSVAYGDSLSPGQKPDMSDITLTLEQGKYSTGLLEAVGVKKAPELMTIHEKDARGRDRRLWILENASVSGFSVGGARGSSSPPTTSISLDFPKITLETIDYTPAGMALPPRSVSYEETTTGFKGTGTDFGGVIFPKGDVPAQLLDLGSGQMAVTSFSWGARAGAVTQQQSGKDPTRGDPSGDDFTFTGVTGAASLGLFSSVYTAKPLDLVTFTTRDESGRVTAEWNLENVTVSSYGSTGSAGGSQTDSFHLQAARVQLVRHTYDASGNPLQNYGAGWDFASNQEYGQLPSTLTVGAYPTPVQPGLTMQIDGGSQVIPVQAYNWGESAGGAGAEMGDFSVSIPQGAYSTGILKETVGSLVIHPEIDLISRDATGHEVMRWELMGAWFSGYSSAGSVLGGGGAADVAEVHFSQLKAVSTSPNRVQTIASYDTKTGTGTGATLSGNTYTPGGEPALGLEVGGTTIPVSFYGLGFARGADLAAGSMFQSLVSAAPVSVTVERGAWSPGIFASVALGKTYGEASLVSRDAGGRVTGRWKLTDVELTSYSTSAAGQAADTFEIGYGLIERIAEVYDSTRGTTAVYAGGYDLETNMPTPAGDTLGATLAGVKYASGTEPEYGLAVEGSAGLIPVTGIVWGDAQSPGAAEKPSLQQFSLTIPAGAYETGILADVGTTKQHGMTLTRRDAQGRAVLVYRLTGAKFTLISTQESPGQSVMDQVVVDFAQVRVDRIDYASDGTSSKTTIAWTPHEGTGIPAADFGGQVFAPGSEPEMLLDLGKGQVALERFSWGATRSKAGSSAGDFNISAAAGRATLGLISAPLTGTRYDQVLLTTRAADGRVLTQWRLKGVAFSRYFGFDAPGSATDAATMSFESIELIYNLYAPVVAVDPVTPDPRNTAAPALTLRFSEPVTGLDLSDLRLTRDGGADLLTASQTLTTSDGGRTWILGNLSTLTGGTDGTYELSISTSLAAGIYGNVTGEPLESATPETWVLDRVAPAIAAAGLDYSVSPNQVRVTFGEDVGGSVSKDDLAIEALTTGAPPAPAFAGFSYNRTTHVAVWTLAAPLADGDYRASLAAGSVSDLASNPIASSTFDFFSFKGDANHDRSVDFNDLVILAQNYNTTGKTFGQGDLNYDGNVDFNDLVILAQRYNTTLAPPGAAAPVEAAASSFAADWAVATAGPVTTPEVQTPAGKRKAKERPVFSARPIVPVRKAAPAPRLVKSRGR